VEPSARSTLLAVVTLLLVSSCSRPAQVTLFNHTDAPIKVYLERHFIWSKKALTIGPGMSARFDYPDTAGQWTLRVSESGCELAYPVPHYLSSPFPRPAHHVSDLSAKAQLEPDSTIYLIPPDATTVVDVASVASFQIEGFPLRPSARGCPRLEAKT
jgi:hypothetical protein